MASESSKRLPGLHRGVEKLEGLHYMQVIPHTDRLDVSRDDE